MTGRSLCARTLFKVGLGQFIVIYVVDSVAAH